VVGVGDRQGERSPRFARVLGLADDVHGIAGRVDVQPARARGVLDGGEIRRHVVGAEGAEYEAGTGKRRRGIRERISDLLIVGRDEIGEGNQVPGLDLVPEFRPARGLPRNS
jgi:hypothetical protein